MTILFIFVLGLIVGSFLNAVIHRLHSGESVVSDRSRCVHCHHVLTSADLIPIFSFVWLGGKCRYCQKPISWQYPIIELTTAVTIVLLAQNFEFRISNFEFWYQVVFASTLIVIGVFDFKHYLILDRVVYPALGLAIVWSIVNGHLVNSLLGAITISGFFALQYFISRGRWIGFGDVKFGLFLGMLFGVKLGLTMLFISYLLGAFVGLGLILAGRKNLGSRLPFGSFLAISAIITMLYGPALLGWYLGLIGL